MMRAEDHPEWWACGAVARRVERDNARLARKMMSYRQLIDEVFAALEEQKAEIDSLKAELETLRLSRPAETEPQDESFGPVLWNEVPWMDILGCARRILPKHQFDEWLTRPDVMERSAREP